MRKYWVLLVVEESVVTIDKSYIIIVMKIVFTSAGQQIFILKK